VTLGDLAKYSMTLSVAWSLCDSWASCRPTQFGAVCPSFSLTSRYPAKINVRRITQFSQTVARDSRFLYQPNSLATASHETEIGRTVTNRGFSTNKLLYLGNDRK